MFANRICKHGGQRKEKSAIKCETKEEEEGMAWRMLFLQLAWLCTCSNCLHLIRFPVLCNILRQRVIRIRSRKQRLDTAHRHGGNSSHLFLSIIPSSQGLTNIQIKHTTKRCIYIHTYIYVYRDMCI